MITLTANNKQIKVRSLIDTGASVTLMRADLYKKICRTMKRPFWLCSAPPLCSVSGGKLKVVGTTHFKFDFCKSHEIIIVEDILHECILGIDFLTSAKGELLFVRKSVRLYDHTYPYIINKSSAVVAVETDTGSQEINKPVFANSDVFSTEEYKLGKSKLEPSYISTGNARPVNQRPRRLPLEKMQLVEQIKEMEEASVIRVSNSLWASPILVPKKDGSTRFCIDYRALNAVTVTDAYSLPSIQDIFDFLEGATIFSTIDLTSGYWQIPMHPDSVGKTAFCTHMGNYEFLRMSFGLKKSGSCFQRTLNKTLSG